MTFLPIRARPIAPDVPIQVRQSGSPTCWPSANYQRIIHHLPQCTLGQCNQQSQSLQHRKDIISRAMEATVAAVTVP